MAIVILRFEKSIAQETAADGVLDQGGDPIFLIVVSYSKPKSLFISVCSCLRCQVFLVIQCVHQGDNRMVSIVTVACAIIAFSSSAGKLAT